MQFLNVAVPNHLSHVTPSQPDPSTLSCPFLLLYLRHHTDLPSIILRPCLIEEQVRVSDRDAFLASFMRILTPTQQIYRL